MDSGDYQARLEAETRNYADCVNVEDLPPIFHYWSNRHLRPQLERYGFSSPRGMIRAYVDKQRARAPDRPLRFVSIGSGNGELEIDLAAHLRSTGHPEFVIDCLDWNAAMLERARVAAAQNGVEPHINLVQCDFNTWEPAHEYDAAIAHQALHHVLNLEHLLTAIRGSLKPHGRLILAEMIGRNGHQLWPEALEILDEFWRELPPSYRFNLQLHRYEELFVNQDWSEDGFEAIRSQEILALLIEHFEFELFLGYANVINPFVDRSFGPHFNPASSWDTGFIDRVHACDEQAIRSGRIKPTQMLAVLGNAVPAQFVPEQYVRWPDRTQPAARPHDPYRWDAWPHPAQSELEIACKRLAESTERIRISEQRLAEQQEDLKKRTLWAWQIERERDERTAWALRLDNEIAELEAHAARLEHDLLDRTAWAKQLEQELEQAGASTLDLNRELQERTEWALRLAKELEERTAWALQLRNELDRTARLRSLQDRLNWLLQLPARAARRLARLGRAK